MYNNTDENDGLPDVDATAELDQRDPLARCRELVYKRQSSLDAIHQSVAIACCILVGFSSLPAAESIKENNYAQL